VRKACEDSGLTPLVYCVGGWNNSHIDVMERGFEFAAGLGAGVINGTIPCHGNEAALDRIDELAQKYKIRFSIENHAHPALESPEEIIAVLESHSAYIGANLDVGIYYRTGYDVLAAAKLFGPRIYHVHFKDVKGRNAAGSCASGTGEAPLKELADYLKSVGYAGMISLEHEPRYDPRPDLDAGVPYCKKILGIA
jgi:sugar phosphate isomerase/epimerase